MYFLSTGSPLNGRQNFSFGTFFIIFFLIASFIVLIWFITNSITKYHKSDIYIEKQKSKPTTSKEIKILHNKYNIPIEQLQILLDYCKTEKVPNILFTIKENQLISELFKKIYLNFKAKNVSDTKMNLFFKLHYSLEVLNAQSKTLLSTKQISPGTMLFYLTEESEKLPFTLIKQTKDYMALEVPEFFVSTRIKPELLSRARFVFRTSQGLTHNFISRIMRYEKDNEGKNLMLISHSEHLVTQTQRHYKREMFDENCYFSPAKKSDKEETKFFISNKKYDGVLSNISGGGCCIKTKLPIRENQHLAMIFPSITGIDLKIIGIIKRTRRLPDSSFALHIQFINIPISSQNKILAFVYKYEL